MLTIKNKLNQPLTADGKSLAAGGTMKVRAMTEDLQRLQAKGMISVVEPAPAPAKQATTDKAKEGEKK